ncbi:ABC transporter substrate-binding protein [Nocardiopsis metallicus]|uniref:Peptide/nickel transport system substrate-binding protein n=1 Tax=Nocardiopsis metallicus TaxID=179819 RepID=A0A840WCF8_9ACTN|nr:ABC transporter substrate-binding protein [Nocardiopsis metallicus]MBB5493852.1 peptide/nickel transport system substrate-binding protein [Nocardiopsis metallicus]
MRKPFLAGAAAVMLATGCSFFSFDPDTESSDQIQGEGEAPMLATLVDSGDLPPLEERLPTEPLVVEPHEEIGRYGGEWNTAILGVHDWPWLGRTVAYENFVRWDPEWEESVPNIATEWEYNDDATELTVTIREGIRWSDGEPFTTDDILFALNDIFNNHDVSPMAAADPGDGEKVDDHTFTISWDEPNALWIENDFILYQLLEKPKHYLAEFHIDHNPDADELAAQEGYTDWIEMLDDKAGVLSSAQYWQNPDMPTIRAWQVVEPLADSGRMVVERNPYYWKVDTEGNQLPYIDRVNFHILQDEEVMLVRALNGEIDMHARHINTLGNRPTLAENRESGGYDFFEMVPGEMNTAMISLNLTHEDDGLRTIFNDKDFRIALSHAINRQDIIDVVYQEQGEPWQGAPRAESPFFNEELAKQYTEYDIDLANEILDEAGYSVENGVRVSPDGTPVRFSLSVPTDFRTDIVDSMEMVVGFWQDLDIDVDLNTEDRSLWQNNRENNTHDANVWSGDAGLMDAVHDPRWYGPLHSGESNFAIPWAQWYTSGGEDSRSIEPPQDVQDHMAMYDAIQGESDPDVRIELMKEFLAESQEQFYAMGISLTPPGYGIVANDFRNVPASMPSSSVYNDPGPTNPEQYFIEE